MAKKSSGAGLFALATGLVAGAAAVFFSDKKNREMVKKEVTKVEKEAMKIAKEVKKNPQKFAKKIEANVMNAEKKVAKKVVKNVTKKINRTPALKAVGKKIAKK